MDSKRQSRGSRFVVGQYAGMVLLLLFAPLCGVLYLDSSLAPYLEFPPTTKYIVHAPFSWPVFSALSLIIATFSLPFIYRLVTFRTGSYRGGNGMHPFPWWGWLGIGIILVCWILAWNRFAFFAFLQCYTFSPLWVGYILTVNALSCRRKGTSLFRDRPRFYCTLFPASSLFWWYFEYLNRFVQNWYYLGGGDISTEEYIIHASICFSTVLPAVLATYEYLATFPRLTEAFYGWRALAIPGKKYIGLVLLALSFVSLATLAVFPDYLFPLVWISPLLVLSGIQFVNGRPTIFSGVEKGDWQPVVIPALAALVCGFFWEMWNWKSLAHWEYSVPFVHRFELYAMPLLGYAGYLPFGLVCVAAASLINERKTATNYGEHLNTPQRRSSLQPFWKDGAAV